MSIRIDDGFMSLEIDGRVIATATERADGWWEVTHWPRFFDRNQAITALTVTELLEAGATATTRSCGRSVRSCGDGPAHQDHHRGCKITEPGRNHCLHPPCRI